MSTSKLNQVVQAAVQATPPPVRHGRRIRVKYAHQGGKNPLRVIVHGNQVQALRDSYLRYLAGVVRDAFKLEGAPIRVECREAANPYAQRRPKTTARKEKKSSRESRRRVKK